VGEGRLPTNTRFEGRTSSVTRLARQGAIGVPPRCPPRTAPGHRGGQRATHATHRPVTDGVGNAFAMRRPGVRIPAAPPPENPAPPAQTLKPEAGFRRCRLPFLRLRAPRARPSSATKPGSRKPLGWSERVNRQRPTPGRGHGDGGHQLSLPRRPVPARGYRGPTCLARSPSDWRPGTSRGVRIHLPAGQL
jgi:hypothetical protein